ncbi:MAG: acetate--CoA ligase family protein [Acidimicrobiia bacterium]|nr:acetate--CoA ligase family protein [Acidimicrobiia bacterium]
MRLTEAQAKLLFAERNIPVPRSRLVTTPAEAEAAARELGGGDGGPARHQAMVVKGQVGSGGRGKAGGVVFVENPIGAARAAARLLGSELKGELVVAVLVEEAIDVAAEHYLSVTVDASAGRPVVMRSGRGGIEVEAMVDEIEVFPLDPVDPASTPGIADGLERSLVELFVKCDALIVEINPLAVTTGGGLVALDGKIELDDSARFRQAALHDRFDPGPAPTGSERERRAAELGLRLIELGGEVAVLANGAGLTMATMDAVVAAGGRPANFCEIGGDAYTKATPALELVLAQPGVRSLVVNFCGAFARCDVMTEGVVEAWERLRPQLPVAFSVAGTGRDAAVDLLRSRLGVEPHPSMEAAVRAAVAAAAPATTEGSEV